MRPESRLQRFATLPDYKTMMFGHFVRNNNLIIYFTDETTGANTHRTCKTNASGKIFSTNNS